MKTDMDGKQIKAISWHDLNGGTTLQAEGQVTLSLSAKYHGDRDEFWVIKYEDMIEVARFNCSYIAKIEWFRSN